MNKEIKKYDDNNNLIYCKNSNDVESWHKFDENNNRIYLKYFNKKERWYEEWYENNKLIHFRNCVGWEYWKKYDENNKSILITEQEYNKIEFRKKEKEYLSRKKCSRFELIDI